MENTFFYTFSTIAQTLAGTIALLAAFVLYRLQSLNAEIESNSDRIAGWIEQISNQTPQQAIGLNARQLQSRGQYTDLLCLANKIAIPAGFYPAELERERFPLQLEGKAILMLRFYISLGLTVGLVTVSVLILTVTPHIAVSSLACGVLTGAAIWFTGCMLSYIWLLLKVFR